MNYRIKSANGSIMGPHTLLELKDLFAKRLISGAEKFEYNQSGIWQSVREFPELMDVFDLQNDEATFIRKIKHITEKDKPKEFNFLEEEIPKEKEKVVENPDKTRITPLTLEYLRKLKQEEEKEKKIEEEKKKEIPKPIIKFDKEATQVIDLAQYKSDLVVQAHKIEEEFEEEELKFEKQKEAKVVGTQKTQTRRNKNIKLLVYFIILLSVGMLFVIPDNPEIVKKASIARPEISFPVPFEVLDSVKARKLFAEAQTLLKKETYLDTLEAAKYLRASLENDMSQRDVLGYLIMTYAELLTESSQKLKDAKVVHQLIQVAPTQVYNNLEAATGQALLYQTLKKDGAAIKLIEKYLAIEKNKPSKKLFAIYLESAINNGDLTLARNIFDQLIGQDKKIAMVYKALIDFYITNSDSEKAFELSNKALMDYPQDVGLLLQHCDILLSQQNFNDLKKTVVKIKNLYTGNRPTYYAQYLEFLGILSVINNEPQKAAELFKESLGIYESPLLRSKLANLKAEGSGLAVDLILESKSMKLMEEAKYYLTENKWDVVIDKAIQAVEAAKSYVPARIFLAQVQVKKGLFGLAIESLEKLYKEYPKNPDVAFALLDTYLGAFKFKNAQNHLNVISQIEEIKTNPNFSEAVASFHEAKKDYLQAVQWYRRAINENPLSDDLYYRLAKVFLEFKKFNEAKKFISQAIEIDPSKVEYRTFYAEILYEIDGTDTAIGYLRKLEEEFPQNPYLFGEIAIYYFKSGQIKDFEQTKIDLEKMAYPRTNLSRYLIRVSNLASNTNDVIKYTEELLINEPGDLEARMNLARIFYDQEKYTEALKHFGEVKNLLDSYPKLLYYIARIYLKTGEVEKAYEYAQKEVSLNPSLEDGYVLLGEIYILQSKWVEADREYKRAQSVNKYSFDAYMGLAYLHFKKGQLSESLSLYKQAQTLNPNNPEVYRQLGDVYRLLGLSVDAIESYRVFLSHVPDSSQRPQIESYINALK